MIKRVYIESFGGIRDREMLFGEGLNIVLGRNESGKSTVCAFIRAMLYGVDTQRRRDIRGNMRKRYTPVGGGVMSGVLETDKYVITRTFGATPKTDTATCVCKETGEVIPADKIGYTVTGMSEACFCSTFYMNSFDAYPKSEEELLSRLSSMGETGGDVPYDAVCAVLADLERGYTRRGGAADKALDEARAAQTAYENNKKLEERKKTLMSNYDILIKKRDEARGELERLESAREKLAEQTVELRNRQRALFEEMSRNTASSRRIKPVPLTFAVIFAMIGLMFLFSYLNAMLLLCAGAFVPMIICLKLSGVIKSAADGMGGGSSEVQMAALEKIMEKTGAAETTDVDSKIKRVNDFLVECAARIAKTQEQIKAIRIDSGAEERLRGARAEYERIVNERDSIQIAESVLKKTYEEMQCDFMPQLNKRFSEYFARLTAGEYTSAAADRELRFSVIDRSGALEWEYLSAGTLDCAYFAMRLALCDMSDAEKKGVFVIDDAFLQYDDSRTRNSIQVLSEEKRQTIYFTCRENFGNVKARITKILK